MTSQLLTLLSCKRCNSDDVTKCGHIRGKQRFRCKHCGYTFVLGDERTSEEINLKKAILLLLHVIAGATFHKLGKLFNMCPSQVFRWICKSGFSYPKQHLYGEIKQIKFSEIANMVQYKARYFDSSKPVIVVQGELMTGYPVIMLMQTPSGNNINKSDNLFHAYRTLPYAKIKYEQNKFI